MDKAGGESSPGRETTYAKAQACNPVAQSRIATAVHFCSVGRSYTVGKGKGAMQDSGGHSRWVRRGNLGWTFSKQAVVVVEEWLVWQ